MDLVIILIVVMLLCGGIGGYGHYNGNASIGNGGFGIGFLLLAVLLAMLFMGHW